VINLDTAKLSFVVMLMQLLR